MPASKFTQTTCTAIVASLAAGVSLSDAARASSLDPRTVRGWLQRGRQEGEGPYADFAVAVDAARADTEKAASAPMTEAEVRECLEDQVRAGSIRALDLWFKTYGLEEREPPPTGIDALDASDLGDP